MELGQSLRQIVLTSLEKALETPSTVEEKPVSYWANRKLLPEFSRLQTEAGDRSIDDIVSDIKADPTA